MPQQTRISPLNNFSKGLKTEFTGLNFPEDAVTETSNCVFERIGNVHRRPGIDYETNYTLTSALDRTSKALNTYKWNNVGGDGSTQIVVAQIGDTLQFFRSSTATIASPLSSQLLGSTIDVSDYVASGGSFDATLECQFADGNGYLFVFHPSCDPFYCSYSSGTIVATKITIQIRDFMGLVDGLADDTRPSTLSTEHNYNLRNQGWVQGTPWSADTGFPATIGPTGASNTFSIVSESTAGGVSVGNSVAGTFTGYLAGNGFQANYTGAVSAYSSGVSITLNPIATYSDSGGGTSANTGLYTSRVNSLVKTAASNYITTWSTGVGNYPSNSDVWFAYKNSSGVFSPSSTINEVTISGLAPKGSEVLDSFNQQRTAVSGVSGITAVTTTARPRTGTFFQGRVWYAGIDSSFAASGDAAYTTWTENIYFSQIIERPAQFGRCYQVNNPTDETTFDLLPSDGGVIVIQGSGSIYKLFPVQNGLLVFAANGIWFITGSQGIGFTANDYTVTKLSGIQSISSTSYVDVQGYPMWCNAEGIYAVMNTQSGLQVEPVTFATIQTFYDTIPLSSKKYIRGAYDPLDWQVRWIFKSTEETGTTDRYQFDGILVFNTAINSFYPWSLSTQSDHPYIHGINYVQSPGGSTAPEPTFKYFTSRVLTGVAYRYTFSEEKDTTNWVDWDTPVGDGVDYTSYFVSGYRIKGGSAFNFQTNYIYLYLNNDQNAEYKIQGLWDWAINQNSGKYTTLEQTAITASTTNFGVARKRHRIRGRGMTIQFKVTSVSGEPFDIIGWTVQDMINPGV